MTFTSLANMWNECNCAVACKFWALPFYGIGIETDLFQSCGHCWVLQIFWNICEWLQKKREREREGERLMPPFRRLALPGDVLQDQWLFLLYSLTTSPSLVCLLTSVSPCFSLWVFFSVCSTHTPARQLLEDIILPSSGSAGFLNSHIPCLVSWRIHWPVVQWAEWA